MKKSFFLILFVLISLCFSGCDGWTIPKTDEYAKYTLSDPHLTYLKASKICGKGFLDQVGENRIFVFRKLEGENTQNFVAAKARVGFPFGADLQWILQSPDNTISVLDDWTIREIRLYPADSGKEAPWRNTFERLDPHELYGDAAPKEAVEEFRALADRHETEGAIITRHTFNEEVSQFVDEDGRVSDTSDTAWCLRVFFNESDTIVWDTEASSTWDPQGIGGRWLYLDMGREFDEFHNHPLEVYLRLPDNSSLYQWINSTIESYTAEHPTTAAETDRTQK